MYEAQTMGSLCSEPSTTFKYDDDDAHSRLFIYFLAIPVVYKYVNKLFQFEYRLTKCANNNIHSMAHWALTACSQSKVIDTKAENVRCAIDEVQNIRWKLQLDQDRREYLYISSYAIHKFSAWITSVAIHSRHLLRPAELEAIFFVHNNKSLFALTKSICE